MTTLAPTLRTQDASPETPRTAPPPRTGRALIEATRPYAQESRRRSWWSVLEVTALIALFQVFAVTAPHLALRLSASVIAGLLIVRGFILFHDYQHRALLRKSKLAQLYFTVFGFLVLTPSKAWRDSHNYHHAHNAKIVGSHVGGFACVTTAMWEKMSPADRRVYRLVRHPINIVLAYFTVFLIGMVISPLRRNPSKYRVNILFLVGHAAIVAGLLYFAGLEVFALTYAVPLGVATSVGALLFYVQHSFPDVEYQPRHEWTFGKAALDSSSFFDLPAPLHYLTGNIGYHHVHHLNATIPFYRLPEAMREVPELSQPKTVRMRDIPACFRLKLWDADRGEMVPFPRDA
ncbi:MAG: fatty acid desaturase [Myxococcota bacterium]